MRRHLPSDHDFCVAYYHEDQELEVYGYAWAAKRITYHHRDSDVAQRLADAIYLIKEGRFAQSIAIYVAPASLKHFPKLRTLMNFLKKFLLPGGVLHMAVGDHTLVVGKGQPCLPPRPTGTLGLRMTAVARVLTVSHRERKFSFRLPRFETIYTGLRKHCGFPKCVPHVVDMAPPGTLGAVAITDSAISMFKALLEDAERVGAEWALFFEDDAIPCPGAQWDQLWGILSSTEYDVLYLGNSTQCRALTKEVSALPARLVARVHRTYPVALHLVSGGYAMAVRRTHLKHFIQGLEKRHCVNWDISVSHVIAKFMKVGTCMPAFFTHPNINLSVKSQDKCEYRVLDDDVRVMQFFGFVPYFTRFEFEDACSGRYVHRTDSTCTIQERNRKGLKKYIVDALKKRFAAAPQDLQEQ